MIRDVRYAQLACELLRKHFWLMSLSSTSRTQRELRSLRRPKCWVADERESALEDAISDLEVSSLEKEVRVRGDGSHRGLKSAS